MIITTQTWVSVCCSSSFRRMFAIRKIIDFSISLKFAAQHETFPSPTSNTFPRSQAKSVFQRVPEVGRHCISRRGKAITPPWSGSWLPVPTSTPWTTRAVASELEESTRILHKSVGIWPQNINIFCGGMWWEKEGRNKYKRRHGKRIRIMYKSYLLKYQGTGTCF